MAFLPENQSDRLRCYRNALSNWKYEGAIEFKKVAAEWLRNELPSFTVAEIKRQLHEHVANGGRIDEQPETRERYVSFQFHYDLRVNVGGRLVYFESILICDDPNDPDDPQIIVVSVHDV